MIDKIKKLLICACLVCGLTLQAEVIRLWEGDAPGAKGKEDKDIPTLTIYRPDKPNGASVVLTPGGGYHAVSEYEGTGNALYLNQFGITAFVLKYRIAPDYQHPCMLQDAQRAIRLVRYHAKEWGLDPSRVGVMGGSAGGHMACMAAVHGEPAQDKVLDPIDRLSSRPDVAILCYAVITMMGNEFVPGQFADMESKDCLLGTEPSEGLCVYMSGEKMVSKNTPPCFVWNTLGDDDVAVENALDFVYALRKNAVPFALHVYEKGGHGHAPIQWERVNDKPVLKDVEPHPWAKDLVEWLKIRKFVE